MDIHTNHKKIKNGREPKHSKSESRPNIVLFGSIYHDSVDVICKMGALV